MPSQALHDFKARLRDVQQLIDAHDALTRLRRAQDALQTGGQELSNIGTVIQHLVTDPGVGRRKEVHALNNAAIALLSGNLQGFIVDIFKESAATILGDRVQDVDALTNAAYTRGNPNEQNIRGMFNALGFPDIFKDISWQRMSTKSLKEKLREFNTLRNRIVHGSNERVRKQMVVNYLKAWENFATRLDSKLSREIHLIMGQPPW